MNTEKAKTTNEKLSDEEWEKQCKEVFVAVRNLFDGKNLVVCMTVISQVVANLMIDGGYNPLEFISILMDDWIKIREGRKKNDNEKS